MHQSADTGVSGGAGNGGCTFDVQGIERLASGRGQHGDEIDDGIGTFDGGADRIRIAQIGLHGVDLADIAHRLQVAGKIGAPHGRAHAPSLPCQCPHRVPSDEP